MSASLFTSGRIDGRHVLAALLVFFGTLFVVNGIFLYYAVGTFNGFETSDAYRKGLNYNDRIAADTAQLALGWNAGARLDPDRGRLVLEITDKTGSAVAGFAISGELRRPVTDREDVAVEFSEVSPGQYVADVSLAAGQWTLSARAARHGSPGAPAFRFKQRLWAGRQ